MNISAILFYIIGTLVLGCAIMAVSRPRPVHAVLYLIVALVGVALIFLLLGAPLLAALQVILYAGAIMVLFLFVIITMPEKTPGLDHFSQPRMLWPLALCLSLGFGLLALIHADPGATALLPAAQLSPRIFGIRLFREYWYAVELVSLLLFVGLAGALYLGRSEEKSGKREAR